MTSSSFGKDTVRTWAPGGVLSDLATTISPASASSAGSLSCESLSCRSGSTRSGLAHHPFQVSKMPALPTSCHIRWWLPSTFPNQDSCSVFAQGHRPWDGGYTSRIPLPAGQGGGGQLPGLWERHAPASWPSQPRRAWLPAAASPACEHATHQSGVSVHFKCHHHRRRGARHGSVRACNRSVFRACDASGIIMEAWRRRNVMDGLRLRGTCKAAHLRRSAFRSSSAFLASACAAHCRASSSP